MSISHDSELDRFMHEVKTLREAVLSWERDCYHWKDEADKYRNIASMKLRQVEILQEMEIDTKKALAAIKEIIEGVE